MTLKERLACLFGFHPRNPAAFITNQRHYVVTCHNGDTPWYEKCPRCDRWHYSFPINRGDDEWYYRRVQDP